jgi:hypothetical protein
MSNVSFLPTEFRIIGESAARVQRLVTARHRHQPPNLPRGVISKSSSERQHRISNSMKKLVWPRITGTRLFRVHFRGRDLSGLGYDSFSLLSTRFLWINAGFRGSVW